MKNTTILNKYSNMRLKLTPQRLAILDYLEGNKEHPSADDVYKAVVKKFPTMSFATVYTTLAALTQKGNVHELTIDTDKKRFDPDTTSHNHMICVSCKKIVDVPGEYSVFLPESARQGFSVIKNNVEFYGLCPECRKKGE